MDWGPCHVVWSVPNTTPMDLRRDERCLGRTDGDFYVGCGGNQPVCPLGRGFVRTDALFNAPTAAEVVERRIQGDEFMRRLVGALALLGLACGCSTPEPAIKPDQGARALSAAPDWGKPATPPTLAPRPGADGEHKDAERHALMVALEQELERHKKILAEKTQLPPYFIGFTLTEVHSDAIEASSGALVSRTDGVNRYIEVEIRVGDYDFDNTNRNRGGGGGFASRTGPLDDDPQALRKMLWRITEETYRDAAEAYLRVKANEQVSVEEADDSGDFTKEEPVVYREPWLTHELDDKAWEDRIRTWSEPFRQATDVLSSGVSLRASTINTLMINSEGTELQYGERRYSISLRAEALADDGMDLARFESAFARSPQGLPDDQWAKDQISTMIKDLTALKAAPVVEPWVGPVILSGRAAGVFFHEIFGHRIEGHRQRDEHSGQTFTSDLGKVVLPTFLSVTDDPTAYTYNGTELSGHYRFDDEGVRAQRVGLIEDGELQSFLTSRLPLAAVRQSNGHGRRQVGRRAVARQGNLMVTPSHSVSYERLRALLVEELERQGKPFGYVFEDISGGFTNTARFSPQAFKVTPLMVYRVFADGRPDELVRGVDIAGTPKTVFQKIIASADDYQVFNGFCGAESGWVPVSATSPSLLVSEVEIEKKAKLNQKGPLLPAPPMEVTQ